MQPDRRAFAPQCSICGGTDLNQVLDLGDVALAGAFLKPEQFAAEKRYPLKVVHCGSCQSVQVQDPVDPAEMFTGYFYFSSAIGTLRDHFAEYAAEVTARFLDDPSRSTVVEFGCNDGVLLKPLADQGIRTVIGVDPAANVLATLDDPRVTKVNAYFDEGAAKEIRHAHGAADLVMANNVFAHIPDINGATAGVAELLSDEGVFVFEIHHLSKVVGELQYDMIYHEHLFYHSLMALENLLRRHGLAVFDVKDVPTHGGSKRFHAARIGSRRASRPTARVEALRAAEAAAGYDQPESYAGFAAKVAERRDRLNEALDALKAKGRRVYGYGASGRANTIIQYCGIGPDRVQTMIDDAPAKKGFFTPGSHIRIAGSDVLSGPDRPDCVLVFAWTFLPEISRRCAGYLDRGGRLLVPMPEVSVVFHPRGSDWA